jgi:hypothetical protein
MVVIVRRWRWRTFENADMIARMLAVMRLYMGATDLEVADIRRAPLAEAGGRSRWV